MPQYKKHAQPTDPRGEPSPEDMERIAKQDEAAEAMAQDAVRKMTDGQGHDVDEAPESIEEIVGGGGMHVSGDEELTRSDSPPEDAEAEPLPKVVGDGP